MCCLKVNEYLQDLGNGATVKFILVPYNDTGEEFNSVTLFRGDQRSIKLTLRNLGTASEVKLATVGSSGGAAFTVSVSPTTVTVAANAMTEITLTVQAPVSIPGSTTASLQLIVTATTSDNILRKDFVVFDVFASNIKPPVVVNPNFQLCSIAIPTAVPTLWLITAVVTTSMMALTSQ